MSVFWGFELDSNSLLVFVHFNYKISEIVFRNFPEQQIFTLGGAGTRNCLASFTDACNSCRFSFIQLIKCFGCSSGSITQANDLLHIFVRDENSN